jgi:hypothetical protein
LETTPLLQADHLHDGRASSVPVTVTVAGGMSNGAGAAAAVAAASAPSADVAGGALDEKTRKHLEEPDPNSVWNFAYGSNMNPAVLTGVCARTPMDCAVR